MKYNGRVFEQDSVLFIENEGLRLGDRFLDYADVKALRPINHRIFIDTLSGEEIEISMLGFFYDGFWGELTDRFGRRSMEALFAEEPPVMRCEDGEYQIPGERGRGTVVLLPDAICILPPTWHAIRIPLCFTQQIRLDGYLLNIVMLSGACYVVGRMGYDTVPFAERAQQAAIDTKNKRAQALAKLELKPPFTHSGLFRTERPDQYWMAAFGEGRCAVELFTEENTATYLYRFTESKEQFLHNLEEAMEAVGIHREIIYLSQDQLNEKPLYRMAVDRSAAVRFLRSKAAGRLIHNALHERRLSEFLG